MAKIFLRLHRRLLKHGLLNKNGLCYEEVSTGYPLRYNEFFYLIEPTDQERWRHQKEGFDYAYWAADSADTYVDTVSKYSKLRQNLVLLMAAMNGEL